MMQADRATQLYERWMEMWNGDLDAAGEIFATGCVAHPAPTTGEPPVWRGPEGMRQLVEQGRAIFSAVTFRALGEPIVAGDWLACRWLGEGTYAGACPARRPRPARPSHSAASMSGSSRAAR